MNESDIVATQLVLGKQVLEIILDLLTNEKKTWDSFVPKPK